MENIKPVVPPAPYLGGKSKLAATIIDQINQTEHSGFADVFCGMLGVFLRRNRQPKTEVINDVNRDVVTLFRILQRQYPQFQDALKYQFSSRSEFDRLKRAKAEDLLDVERAARFLYLQKLSFGGKVTGQNFGVKCDGGSRFDLSRLMPVLNDVAERLHGVTIECLNWSDLIDQWDRAGMLFYLDPPYWDCETDYGKGVFSKDDFQKISDRLRDIEGNFIFSINDTPEIREIFSPYYMREVGLTYTAGSGSPIDAKELIISDRAFDMNAGKLDLF